MGYTNYWSLNLNRKYNKKYLTACRQINRFVKKYNKAIKAINPESPCRLSGYTAHAPLEQYLGINFNGVGEYAHETFVLRETLNLNENFNFCKTNNKPYDFVVKVSLCILKHYLGDAVKLSSDDRDGSAWLNAIKEANKFLKSNKLNVKNTWGTDV